MLEEGLIGGRYKLGSRLGGGGMGTVYEAIDLVTKTLVAVKLLRSEHLTPSSHASRRFEREAHAIGALAIPTIVRLLDAGHDSARNVPYIVMERLRGRDLKQFLDELGPLPPAFVVRMAAHAAMGLRAAHAMGIVHRDIKPANLFLASDPDVAGGASTLKVLDFGVSKFDKTALYPENTSVSVEGSMIGSPAYMSPEQARGESDVDARTDIWSLGVVMYEALTGHLPFGENLPLGQIILAICSQPARPIASLAPSVPPALASIVHRAIAKSRDERWQSADELLSALRELDEGCDEPIPPALSKVGPRSSTPPPSSLPPSYARETATETSRPGTPPGGVAIVLGDESVAVRPRHRRIATFGIPVALGAAFIAAFALGRWAPAQNTGTPGTLPADETRASSVPAVHEPSEREREPSTEEAANRQPMLPPASAIAPVAATQTAPVTVPAPQARATTFDAGRAPPEAAGASPGSRALRLGRRTPPPASSVATEDVYAP